MFLENLATEVFPYINHQTKMAYSYKKLQSGDVVIIKEMNPGKGILADGYWQMAIVDEAIPGKDGYIRDVTLKYKNLKPGKSYEGSLDIFIKRSVHNLVLILSVEEQTDCSH